MKRNIVLPPKIILLLLSLFLFQTSTTGPVKMVAVFFNGLQYEKDSVMADVEFHSVATDSE